MTNWRSVWGRAAVGLGVVLGVIATSPGVASAGTGSLGAVTCHGGSVAPGTYSSLRIAGICSLDAGDVRVRGDLTILAGGGLNAGFGGSNLTIAQDLVVKPTGLLVLGCEPEAFICFNDPDQNVGTLSTDDRVSGSLLATRATLVVVHHSHLGAVIQSGGGGGVTCSNFPLGQNGPPAYTDYEDNAMAGSVSIVGLRTCWSGFIRNHVAGSVTYSNITLADPDGNELVTNVIRQNLICTGDSPKVQVGDSGGSPNVVRGRATGQCAHIS